MNEMLLISTRTHNRTLVVRFGVVRELDEPAEWTEPRVMTADDVLDSVRAWLEELATRR